MNIELPTFLKSHILFDFHLQDFLETWGSLGAFSEENIESTHPIFNQLLRRYGNTRGRQLKRNVMKGFIVERASFVLESVDGMMTSTSTTKRPNMKKRSNVVINLTDIEDASLYSSKLTEMEEKMNLNEKLRCDVVEVNTCITACAKCGKRVLNFGLPIHNLEYHSGSIVNDVDDDVVERLQEVARLGE